MGEGAWWDVETWGEGEEGTRAVDGLCGRRREDTAQRRAEGGNMDQALAQASPSELQLHSAPGPLRYQPLFFPQIFPATRGRLLSLLYLHRPIPRKSSLQNNAAPCNVLASKRVHVQRVDPMPPRPRALKHKLGVDPELNHFQSCCASLTIFQCAFSVSPLARSAQHLYPYTYLRCAAPSPPLNAPYGKCKPRSHFVVRAGSSSNLVAV